MSSALGRYLEHFKCHWPESKVTKENIFCTRNPQQMFMPLVKCKQGVQKPWFSGTTGLRKKPNKHLKRNEIKVNMT